MCMTPECKSPSVPVVRGLCAVCYRSAKRLVDNGKTTWTELETMGLALPAHQGSRTSGLLLRAFRAKQNGE